MNDGRMTMDEWKAAIAEEREREKAWATMTSEELEAEKSRYQDGKYPAKLQMAWATAKSKEVNAARKAGMSATAPAKSGADPREVKSKYGLDDE